MTRQGFGRLPAAEREDWAAEWEAERSTCPSCGNPVEECSDPTVVWYSYRRVCYASMERAGAEARYERLHGDKSAFQYHDGTWGHWAAKRTSGTPYRFDEGVTIGVDSIDRAPWDEFTTEAEASPVPPDDDEAVTPDGSSS